MDNRQEFISSKNTLTRSIVALSLTCGALSLGACGQSQEGALETSQAEITSMSVNPVGPSQQTNETENPDPSTTSSTFEYQVSTTTTPESNVPEVSTTTQSETSVTTNTVASPETEISDFRIGFDGFGPFHIGMTLRETAAQMQILGSRFGPACGENRSVLEYLPGTPTIGFDENDTMESIRFDMPGAQTISGIGIGSSLDKLHQTYTTEKGYLLKKETTPDWYIDKSIEVWRLSNDNGGVSDIIFVTAGQTEGANAGKIDGIEIVAKGNNQFDC